MTMCATRCATICMCKEIAFILFFIGFLNGTKPQKLARKIGQLKTPYGSHFQNVPI